MAKEIKREVVKASETKAEAEKATKKKKVDTETGEKEVVQAKPTGNAVLKRVFAVVFWLLAIAAEVAAIMLLNGYLYIPQNSAHHRHSSGSYLRDNRFTVLEEGESYKSSFREE